MIRHAHAAMRFLAAGTAVSGLVLAMGAVPAAGAARQLAGVRVAPAAGGTWGTAIEVPGLGALNTGLAGQAVVSSVSCRSAGNCSAGGQYTDGSGHSQGFVVSQVSGQWGTAIEVPGLGALNTGGSAQVGPVSCGAAGKCSAGGSYSDSSTNGSQGFVVSES